VLLKAVDTSDQGRLPGTGRPTDNNPLLFLDGKVDVLQNVKLAKPFMHCGDFDDGITGQDTFIVLGGLRRHKDSLLLSLYNLQITLCPLTSVSVL
jgi:hypothetical protein